MGIIRAHRTCKARLTVRGRHLVRLPVHVGLAHAIATMMTMTDAAEPIEIAATVTAIMARPRAALSATEPMTTWRSESSR